MNLSEFLLARIAEDEEVARDALSRPGAAEWPDWRVYDDGARDPAVVASPQRALAECEAKRRIIDAAWADHLQIEGEWGHGRGRDELTALNDYPEVVQLLALPYTGHPDFREEWRP